MRTLNAAALLLLASGATALAAPAARAQDGAFTRGDGYSHSSSSYDRNAREPVEDPYQDRYRERDYDRNGADHVIPAGRN